MENRGAVFFDRDGVLVRSLIEHGLPKSSRFVADLVLIPEAVRACHWLHSRGIRTFMVTNQPDIARGLVDRTAIDAQNAVVQETCRLTDSRTCPHDDDDRCSCRKPLPGMILDLAAVHGVDLMASLMIGDRWRDIEAGKQAGLRTVLIDYAYSELRPAAPDYTITSLLDLITILEMFFGREATDQ